MSIFINQSYLKIQLDTTIDLTGATNIKLHYTKPDGTIGYWTGTVNGTFIEYEVQNGNLDQVGTWIFQGVATMPDSRIAITRSVRQKIQAEFT